MSKALYNALLEKGSYTKPYEDFQEDFSTPENQLILYNALNKKGLYTKSKGDFLNQFFPIPEEKTKVETEENNFVSAWKKENPNSKITNKDLIKEKNKEETKSNTKLQPEIDASNYLLSPYLKDEEELIAQPSSTAVQQQVVLSPEEDKRSLELNEVDNKASLNFENYKKKNSDLFKPVYTDQGLTTVAKYENEEAIKKMNQDLAWDYVKNNKEIQNVIIPNIYKKNQKAISLKTQELRKKYGDGNDFNSQEDLNKAQSELNIFVSNFILDDPRYKEITADYQNSINKLHLDDNNAYTVDKHTPDWIQSLQAAHDVTSFSPISPISLYNSVMTMSTGMETQFLKAQEKYDWGLRHSRFQKNLQRENKFDWTNDTPGYVNKNGDFSTSLKAGPGIIYETTWGEAKGKMQKILVANEKKARKDLVDIMNKRAIEGAYKRADFTKFASGENSLQELSLMVSEQFPNMVGALISFGAIPALSEGAGVYETLVIDAARKKYNLEENQQPTAEQMYSVLMDDTGNKIANTSTVVQPVIAALEYIGAKAALTPVFKQGVASLLAGQYKQAAKQAINAGQTMGVGGLTEGLTEGFQTVATSVATGHWDANEFVQAIGMGTTIGIIMPGAGKILTQTKTELSETIKMAYKKYDARTMSKIIKAKKTELDNAFKTEQISKQEYEEKSKALNTIKNNSEKIPNNLNKENKTKALDLLIEKEGLEKQIDGKDKNLVEPQTTRIEDINNELKNISTKQQLKSVRKIAEQVEEEGGPKVNINVGTSEDQESFLTESQADEITFAEGVVRGMREIVQDPNATKEQKQEARDILDAYKKDKPIQQRLNVIKGQSSNYGSMIPTFNEKGDIVSYDLFINEDTSFKDGMLNTAAHEMFHAMIFATLRQDVSAQMEFGQGLLSAMKSEGVTLKPGSNLARRISQYSPEEGLGEEIMTLTSEAELNNEVEFNESGFDMLRNTFRQFGQKYLGKEIKFNTNKDILNFIKDFNKSINEGKGLNQAMLKVMTKGAKGKLVKDVQQGDVQVAQSKVYQEVEAMKPDLTSTDLTAKRNAALIAANTLENEVDRRLPKLENVGKEAREDIVRNFLFSEGRGLTGLLTKYNPDVNESIMGYLNSFVPGTKISLLDARLQEFYKDDPRFGNIVQSIEQEGVTEKVEKQAAEEVTTETKAKRKPKKIVLADRLGMSEKINKAIKKIIPKLDLNKITFKNLKNKIPEITGKLFGISPKKIISGANITKKELQSAQMFINKNADLLIQMLPEGATASGTATGVPQTLLKAFYTKTDRAKMAKTGSKAGLAIQQKNNINKTDFLETFGIIDGKPIRTDRNTSARVLAIANLTGKMITNQTVRAELVKIKSNDKTISVLSDGKSKAMFSKRIGDFNMDGTIDNVLESHADKVGRKTYKFRTEKDVDLYIEAIMDHVLPLMPRRFWFGKEEGIADTGSEFTDSYRMMDVPVKTVNGVDVNKEARKELYAYYVEKINHLNLLPDSAFGENVEGVTDYQRTSYETLFENKKGIQENKIKEVNEKSAKIHEAMWRRFFEAIQKNPSHAAAIGNFFKAVGNRNNHWHRYGAERIGYSLNPKGETKQVKDRKTGKYKTVTRLYEYEHAMPATASYLYLIDGALKGYNFESIYKPVMDNFKLIALDVAENKKLSAAKLGTSMPKGWNTIDNFWWERYFNDQVEIDPSSIVTLNGKTFKDAFSIPKLRPNLTNSIIVSNAIKKGKLMSSKKSKGISVLDFDDTLATTKSLVKYTAPDGKNGTLNAEEYANTYQDLLDQGYTFDFSEFNKVVKGKLAPLFQKALKLQGKFGPENMFVLTARPTAAQKAIFDFLKANGLNIPIKNITGLGNSTSEAKALWIADKVGEGYNDFYFADDALQNVQAVKNMLDQFDVKSKVQQAKVNFSKRLDPEFNNILEEVTGIETKKRFSDIKARKRGASKGKFRLFIPPSHEDFVGLLYNFMGKGRKGDQHRNFFEQALVRPLNRAYREIDTAKQAIANDYKELNKQFPKVKSKLRKKTPDGDFIFEDALRVYLWNKHNYDIPGLSPTDQANLSELIMNDAELQAYAETLNVISKQDTYIDPGQGWEAGNIKTDLIDATGRVGRAEYFAEFNENADILFSPENLNKIEAGYGKDFRSALEDMLHRIKTGVNRPKGQSGTINSLMNYLNGSVGTVMFFNVRSAILQQMSIVNYINFADNNLFAAAKAFANQKQYWKDFAFIFNSDMLKQRRGGIGTDINGADLAQAVQGSKQPTKIVISKLLKLGFLPTQIGDNIAIATGGATFYRNRVNKYIKDGLNKKEAETRAFTDFQDLTQSTQQSSRPDMTSKQQASWIGKLVLNFQNITSQYNRIIKKAALDIGKGRISPPYTTKAQSNLGNLSKILYYGAIQNVIFYSLQTALFAVMFGDDEDEDQILKKSERVINGSIDSILRGAGIYGAVVSTLKNAIIKWKQQREPSYNKDESGVLMELLNFSPVVGIKSRMVVNAEKTLNYNENVISEMETFQADNPMWSAATNYTQALTNFPANRLYQKSINMRNALDKDYTNFQRVMFFSGYTTWSLGLGDTEAVIEAKEKVKINKANARKEKRVQKQIEKLEANKSIIEENKKKKDGRCAHVNTSGNRCKNKAIKDGFCSIHEKVEQRKDGKKVQCRKYKENGKRCKVQTSNKSGYCYYHD